ncbi:MAG TPA: phosphoglycerate dehydrogenase [Candidatus Limnocylindria bacterium]|nr:phosphoglycerate dehydrogenase [Candidatus Limnocylindria bacterium]
MRILVAEPLAEEGLRLLRSEHEVDVQPGLSRADLLACLPGYEALVVRSQVSVDAEALAAAGRLLVVGRAGVGVDNIDLDAATRAGVTVVNAPTANTVAAAEHSLGLLYALARRIPAADASLRAGEWQRSRFLGQELRGKTLGIVGLGKIGMAVAERARSMEMELLGHDPFVTEEAAAQRGIRLLPLPELLGRADVVTVHVPLTRATQGMIGEEQLALMTPSALLVNVARGGVVDEAALAAALREGRLAGAAVDVFETEPPRDSPLLGAPNTVLTPHLGASTEEAQVRVAVETAQQILDVLAGRSARYAVNAPLVPPETEQALVPYLPLARLLGQFYAQFAPTLEGMTLELAGEIAEHDSAPLAAAVLAGLLETATEERVNTVNAPLLARERGLHLAEHRTSESPRYQSLLTVSGATAVAGTISGGEPRLARLGDYWVDMPPAGWMLVTRHRDRPGTMGRIGLMLGEADVNISAMHLGRREARADALMILALDEPVPPEVAQRIRDHEAVLDMWLIRLSL